MGAVARKKGAPQRAPSPEDEADERALDAAVCAMIDAPLSGWDHSRPLRSLNRADLRKIAMSAITGWILERARQGCENAKTQNDLILRAPFAARNSGLSLGLESTPTPDQNADASETTE